MVCVKAWCLRASIDSHRQPSIVLTSCYTSPGGWPLSGYRSRSIETFPSARAARRCVPSDNETNAKPLEANRGLGTVSSVRRSSSRDGLRKRPGSRILPRDADAAEKIGGVWACGEVCWRTVVQACRSQRRRGLSVVDPYALFNWIGSLRARWPQAAKIALATAGAAGGRAGSPIPPGSSRLSIRWTSIGGASLMRMGS
jgi:hypothetical protein